MKRALLLGVLVGFSACTEILTYVPQACERVTMDPVTQTMTVDTIPADSVRYDPGCLQAYLDSVAELEERRHR